MSANDPGERTLWIEANKAMDQLRSSFFRLFKAILALRRFHCRPAQVPDGSQNLAEVIRIRDSIERVEDFPTDSG